jgi:glycogen(starch) synthase
MIEAVTQTGAGGVLHLVWEFPPVIYGGLGRHAEELTRAQHRDGWDVTVVTAAEDVTDPTRRVPIGRRTRRDIVVLRARRPPPRTPWTDLHGAARELDDAMAAAALAHLEELTATGAALPTVVHAHDWIGSRAARTVAARIGAGLVLTVHATEYGRRRGEIEPEVDGGAPAAVHALEREAVAAADLVIVCSAAMRVEVCEVLGADPQLVRVVPNAVDAEAWRSGPAAVRAARRHWLTEESGLLIAAAGRIEWEKGFSTVLRSLPDLRRVHPNLRFVLAGRGSYSPQLAELAAELEVTDLLALPGWLARRDLAALYAAADVVVVPSRYEPSGLVAREAQAAGATVVATRVGGLVETVQDGETGVLMDVGDVHGLRDTISLLAAHPSRGRRMAQAGTAAVRSVTWPDVAAGTTAVYAEAARTAATWRTPRPDVDLRQPTVTLPAEPVVTQSLFWKSTPSRGRARWSAPQAREGRA